jgi:hypothetical protein
MAENPGYRKTGGVADPNAGKLAIYEDRKSQEYSFSQYLISCDPSDNRGFVHLPKNTLIVKGDQIVCEKQTILINKEETIEKAIESLAPYVKQGGRMNQFKYWLHKIAKTPLIEPVAKSGSGNIYQVPYAKGQAKLVLMTPNLDMIPEEIPKGTLYGGTMKRITYLTAFEGVAIGDLAPFIAKKGKSEK